MSLKNLSVFEVSVIAFASLPDEKTQATAVFVGPVMSISVEGAIAHASQWAKKHARELALKKLAGNSKLSELRTLIYDSVLSLDAELISASILVSNVEIPSHVADLLIQPLYAVGHSDVHAFTGLLS